MYTESLHCQTHSLERIAMELAIIRAIFSLLGYSDGLWLFQGYKGYGGFLIPNIQMKRLLEYHAPKGCRPSLTLFTSHYCGASSFLPALLLILPQYIVVVRALLESRSALSSMHVTVLCHACKNGPNVISCHIRIRGNALFQFCQHACLGAQLEAGGSLVHEVRQTGPADILICNWELGKHAAVDLCVPSLALLTYETQQLHVVNLKPEGKVNSWGRLSLGEG